AGDSDRLMGMGEGQLVAECRREAYRIDPVSFVSRRRHAETERHVRLRPAPDTMTWLTALLPVKDGVAAYAALSRASDTARSLGDPRTRGQVMADTLVSSVLGTGVTRHGGPGVAVHVVMTDQVLFGSSDEPAHVDGYGPVPAELARELVAGACSRNESVWLRRLYTEPVAGELVAMEARTRLFPAGLARFIRLRDRTCRTPWCDAPIRHTDHAWEHSAGGPTRAANGQGLCEACNHAKQAPGWRARPTPATGGHDLETTTPTGHTYRSGRASLATVRAIPLRVDYVLAG
ncbi:MAG: DUF222 domain-containing protein, partial [Nocardioides sp.]